MNSIGRQTKAGSARWGVAALVLTVGLAGCDKLLEVNLPAAVTSEAINDPSVAGVLVNSVMANVECGYSSMAMDAAGYEDNWQRYSGVAGNYSEYGVTPSGGTCDNDSYSQEWIDPFLTARGQGYDTYAKISNWGDAVPDKDELMATTAIYTAIVLENFGSFFCESVISGPNPGEEGDLLTPTMTLDSALHWLNVAQSHITAAGDFAITTGAGTHASSAQTLVTGLTARIRWMRSGGVAGADMTAAATAAAAVPDGYMAWILREEAEKRRNMVSSTQGGGGGVQAAGFLQGPIRLKTGENDYGYADLGDKLDGTPWPDSIPYTGYIDLAIETATGRAIGDDGFPINLLEDPVGTERDPRVEHKIGNTAGGPDNIIQKYKSLTDDIPLLNWREMRLIQAEAAGPGAAATALVNSIRTADGLPIIQGAYQTLVESNADRFLDMIIEERRRSLWLEARYWATKLQHTDMLWFPRAAGDLINSAAAYSIGGGVRLLMGTDEYQINPNLRDAGGLALRTKGCELDGKMDQAPVGF